MTSDPLIRVARTIANTAVEGPGSRFAVWVQGCTLRCSGCFNPHMWSERGGDLVAASVLAAQARSSGDEGVTLLGGEPFEQAGALAAFARNVQEAGLSVMTFTGYTLTQVHAMPGPGPGELLAHTDLLVDGPYDASRLDINRPWVGSTNQGFHFLTSRYRHLQESLAGRHDRVEIRIGADGRVGVNGWASDESLDRLLNGLGRRQRES